MAQRAQAAWRRWTQRDEIPPPAGPIHSRFTRRLLSLGDAQAGDVGYDACSSAVPGALGSG
jgi:hypothetical protein